LELDSNNINNFNSNSSGVSSVDIPYPSYLYPCPTNDNQDDANSLYHFMTMSRQKMTPDSDDEGVKRMTQNILNGSTIESSTAKEEKIPLRVIPTNTANTTTTTGSIPTIPSIITSTSTTTDSLTMPTSTISIPMMSIIPPTPTTTMPIMSVIPSTSTPPLSLILPPTTTMPLMTPLPPTTTIPTTAPVNAVEGQVGDTTKLKQQNRLQPVPTVKHKKSRGLVAFGKGIKKIKHMFTGSTNNSNSNKKKKVPMRVRSSSIYMDHNGRGVEYSIEKIVLCDEDEVNHEMPNAKNI